MVWSGPACAQIIHRPLVRYMYVALYVCDGSAYAAAAPADVLTKLLIYVLLKFQTISYRLPTAAATAAATAATSRQRMHAYAYGVRGRRRRRRSARYIKLLSDIAQGNNYMNACARVPPDPRACLRARASVSVCVCAYVPEWYIDNGRTNLDHIPRQQPHSSHTHWTHARLHRSVHPSSIARAHSDCLRHNDCCCCCCGGDRRWRMHAHIRG